MPMYMPFDQVKLFFYIRATKQPPYYIQHSIKIWKKKVDNDYSHRPNFCGEFQIWHMELAGSWLES